MVGCFVAWMISIVVLAAHLKLASALCCLLNSVNDWVNAAIQNSVIIFRITFHLWMSIVPTWECLKKECASIWHTHNHSFPNHLLTTQLLKNQNLHIYLGCSFRDLDQGEMWFNSDEVTAYNIKHSMFLIHCCGLLGLHSTGKNIDKVVNNKCNKVNKVLCS